jgi:hypothetical protein
MLWCQFLPFAALWGCPQAPKAPPGSVAIVEKVMISTCVAELLAPPPPVTVTVTVGSKSSHLHPTAARFFMTSPALLRVSSEISQLTSYSTVVATSVIPATAVPDLYPSAAPGARPTAFKYDDIPDWKMLNTPLPYHNEMIAFGHWFEEASFEVNIPKITPLRLTVAAFMFSCVHMLFLLYHGEMSILQRALESLFQGFWAVSSLM